MELWFQFGEQACKNYEEKKLLEERKQQNKMAFEDDPWKGQSQPRNFIVGHTVHGFYWCVYGDQSFHQPNVDHICKENATEADHLEKCAT